MTLREILLTLDHVKTAAVVTAAEAFGCCPDADADDVRLELRAFVSMLARERCTTEEQVLGQLIVLGILAEGFAYDRQPALGVA